MNRKQEGARATSARVRRSLNASRNFNSFPKIPRVWRCCVAAALLSRARGNIWTVPYLAKFQCKFISLAHIVEFYISYRTIKQTVPAPAHDASYQ